MSRAFLPTALVALACGFAGLGLSVPEPSADTPRVTAVTVADPEAVGRRALALVTTPRPSGYGLRFTAHSPGRPRAQLDRATRTITVFVSAGDVPHRVAHDVAHELGHAWDDEHLTDAARRAYLHRRGATAPWWPEGSWSDYATGAGDFAEVFARCHAASPEFRSRVAPAPADACALLPRAAAGGG